MPYKILYILPNLSCPIWCYSSLYKLQIDNLAFCQILLLFSSLQTNIALMILFCLEYCFQCFPLISLYLFLKFPLTQHFLRNIFPEAFDQVQSSYTPLILIYPLFEYLYMYLTTCLPSQGANPLPEALNQFPTVTRKQRGKKRILKVPYHDLHHPI